MAELYRKWETKSSPPVTLAVNGGANAAPGVPATKGKTEGNSAKKKLFGSIFESQWSGKMSIEAKVRKDSLQGSPEYRSPRCER